MNLFHNVNNVALYFLLYLIFQLIITTTFSVDQSNDLDGFLSWEPFNKFNDLYSNQSIKLQNDQYLASSLLINNQHVYISLTTISTRLYGIPATIASIVHGTVLPNHIYLILSKDAFLLDEGVTEKQILSELTELIELKKIFPHISIIFTKNIGPHRKLLPLLKHKWHEDCVIITIDDHEMYAKTAVAGLLQYYIAANQDAVIALRSRRMAVCPDEKNQWEITPYTREKRGLWPVARPGLREMFTLPTGNGGVLYRPQYFLYDIIFDKKLVNITVTGDDLMFRIAAMANEVEVVTACTQETIAANYVVCPAKPPIRVLRKNADYLESEIIFPDSCVKTDISILSPIVDMVSSSHSLFRRNLKDSAESVSLAYKFNNFGGNNVMWKKAVKYLSETHNFDLKKLLQERILQERRTCFESSLKSWLDKHCGIMKCYHDDFL